MPISVIIVNYRTAKLCADCLDSLAGEVADMRDLHVEVLDGASGDDSVAVLGEFIARRGYSGWCKLTPMDRNGGFAAANNSAIRSTLGSAEAPELYLLLNPDTVVRPGAIRKLVEFLGTHPRAGMVGARLEDPDGTPQNSAFNFPSVVGEFELAVRLGLVTRLLHKWMTVPPARAEAHRCDWVAGACMLVRREVFEQIGLLDEGYFMYYEEVDFCRRAAWGGWECWYQPSARVAHLVGQSSGVTDTKRPPQRLPAYWFESRRRYFEKNHGPAYRIAADVAWTAGHAIYAVYRTLRGRRSSDPPMLARDFLSFALNLRCGTADER
jgi:N-acetylglucosaminyl-diphospho-decaprenol L-rhamnosyltransferase